MAKKRNRIDKFIDKIKVQEPNLEISDVTITKESFVPKIKKHLDNGEILLLGLTEDIKDIEDNAFKPSSKGDMTLIIIHEPITNLIFFAKKTLAFTTYLQEKYGLSLKEITDLQMMWFLEGEAKFGFEFPLEGMYELMDTWLSATAGMKSW